jgi:hypothetical protein
MFVESHAASASSQRYAMLSTDELVPTCFSECTSKGILRFVGDPNVMVTYTSELSVVSFTYGIYAEPLILLSLF